MSDDSKITIRPPLGRLAFILLIFAVCFAFMIWDRDRNPHKKLESTMAMIMISAIMFGTVYGIALRNGAWAIDDVAVYKGWFNRRLFDLSEIERAQHGIRSAPAGGNWGVRQLNYIQQGADNLRAASLVVRLRGNRWFLWAPCHHENDQKFIDRILAASPAGETIKVPRAVLGDFSRGRVIQL